METLRDLLLQRAARLQERPAITAPDWGTLTWTAWRSRVEGVALGLLSEPLPMGTTVHSATGTPWDWACEVAAGCCGLCWDPAGTPVEASFLGGPRFNADAGREPFHDRERSLNAGTPFLPKLTHGELLARLRKLNGRLGWDHEIQMSIPLLEQPQPAVRAALWSLLYAGGHAVFMDGRAFTEATRRRPCPGIVAFDPAEFAALGLELECLK
jgi:hypothetical protein